MCHLGSAGEYMTFKSMELDEIAWEWAELEKRFKGRVLHMPNYRDWEVRKVTIEEVGKSGECGVLKKLPENNVSG